eukprot:2566283-Amphidinium_carterae.1
MVIVIGSSPGANSVPRVSCPTFGNTHCCHLPASCRVGSLLLMPKTCISGTRRVGALFFTCVSCAKTSDARSNVGILAILLSTDSQFSSSAISQRPEQDDSMERLCLQKTRIQWRKPQNCYKPLAQTKFPLPMNVQNSNIIAYSVDFLPFDRLVM